jgi:membrane fusion protein, multidrug efflux system
MTAEDSDSTPIAPEGAPAWRRLLWLAPLALACAAAAFFLTGGSPGPGSREQSPGGSRAVPVMAVSARSGDLGIYQTGLGTVTPLQTVTVRSRVDGELVELGFREGQLVQKGALLAQIDPRPFEVQLHQAEGQLARDEAALKNAQADLERYRILIEQDSVPRQQLDTQAATVEQAQASIKSDRALVESAKLNLTYSRVTAPVTGIAGLRQVDPGNIVRAGDASGIVVLTQQQPIAVVFTLAADHIQAVMKQVRAGRSLAVEAWDRDLKKKLATGTLLAVDNQIDVSTGTVRMKAQFPNADTTLYPNQFVNARLLVEPLPGAVLIPTAAVQRSPQGTFVYVVGADAAVEKRDVQVRITEGDETAIQSGLKPGEVVVTDGVDKLRPGSTVEVGAPNGSRKPSGAERKGGAGKPQ